MPNLKPNLTFAGNQPLFAPVGTTTGGGSQTLSLSGDVLSLSNGGGSVNVSTATAVALTTDKTTAQSYVSGFDSTRFTGEIIAGGNIESAPALGGSVVLNGGLSEVQIGDASGQTPKVRFQVADASDGVIEYNGMAFSFTPPLGGGGAAGGANQDIQYNNSGAFGGNAGFTYDGSNRIVRLTNADGDSRVEVFDPTNSNKVEIKSNQINLKPSDTTRIQMFAGDTNSQILITRSGNGDNTFISSGSISNSDGSTFSSGITAGGFTSSDFITGAQSSITAVGDPRCRVASATLSTQQNVSSFEFYDPSGLRASISYDSSGLVFNPPLPAPPATAPAGADTQLQFNNAGAFGASSNLTFDGDLLQVVGAIDISGATPNLNMADLSGNSFSVALDSTPQPTVVFIGQAGASMTMTPDGVVYNDSTTNVVNIDAVTPFVQVTNGTEASALHAGYVSATLPPLLPDQLTRKDYVDAAVAGASGATPYIIYCSATAAPGGDGSFTLPYNSITDAITAAVAGSVIYLYGTFPMTTTTITKSNFTLKALGQAVIQNTSLTPPTGAPKGWWQTNGGTSNITFDGITFQSTVQPNSELNFLTLLGSNHVVRNCVFAGVSSYDAFNPGAVTTRGLQVSGGVVNLLVEDCEFYNLRQPVYTNAGSGLFLRNSVTNTRGAVNSSAGNFFQWTDNVFGQNVLDIVILAGVQSGAPYADLYQLSADNNFAVVQDQRVTPTITIQANIPAITVQAASGTIALTPAMNRSTYILTGTSATQIFDASGLAGQPAGFCVYLRNGNNSTGTTLDISIGIIGVVGTVPLHTITATTNSGGMLLYWNGSVLTRYR